MGGKGGRPLAALGEVALGRSRFGGKEALFNEFAPEGAKADTMQEPVRKLVLSKETLRTLDDDELTEAVGGDFTGICVHTVICQSGVCRSAVCRSVACNSVAICA